MPTLNDTDAFRQFYDFLEANRALASTLTLEFTQDSLRSSGAAGTGKPRVESVRLGFRFSMDRVSDLRIGPRDLADMGVRFVKDSGEPVAQQGASSSSDIHAADLSDLLGRHGISLIAGTHRDRGDGDRPARLRCSLRPGLPVLGAASCAGRSACRPGTAHASGPGAEPTSACLRRSDRLRLRSWAVSLLSSAM